MKIVEVKKYPLKELDPTIPNCKKFYDISFDAHFKMNALSGSTFPTPAYAYGTWNTKNGLLKTALDKWYITGTKTDEVRQEIISAAQVCKDILDKNGVYVESVANTNPANENEAADTILSAGYKHSKLTSEEQTVHPKPEFDIKYGAKSIEVAITNAEGRNNTYIFLLMGNDIQVDFGAGKAINFISPGGLPQEQKSFMIFDTVHKGKFINLPSGYSGNVACLVLNSKGYSEMSAVRSVGVGF